MATTAVGVLEFDGGGWGTRFIDPGTPLLRADDLSAVRGDGIFETMLVRSGRIWKSGAHLDRLAGSAAALDLPLPPHAALEALLAELAGRAEGESALRLVVSRGSESAPADAPAGVTCFATLAPVAARVARVRADGVRALTADRGYRIDFAARAPWQLLGAKTLSYAANMAALRWAEANGAEEVVYLSADGEVLEGPRSTVVIGRNGGLVTPPADRGILPGTTVTALFGAAQAEGIKTETAPLRKEDLFTAEGVWLVSSITLQARVHTLDGVALPAAPLHTDVVRLIDASIG